MASRFNAPVFDGGKGVTPADGLQLFFYETGTTTPRDTYTNEAATIANANPVISDSNGVFPDIWIAGTYKVVLKDKNGVQTGFGEADPVSETAKDLASADLRYSPTFASVAAMTAATPLALDGSAVTLVAGMSVKIQGFNIAGDKGAKRGLIVPAQAADEFGDHTNANGTVFVMKEEVITFEQFGYAAAGDNAEIEAALLYSITHNKRIHLQGGEYTQTAAITISMTGDQALDIAGNAGTKWGLNFNGDNLTINMPGNWWLHGGALDSNKLSVRDIEFTTTLAATGRGIVVIGDSVQGRGTPLLHFSNLIFRGYSNLTSAWSRAVYLKDAGGADFNSCKFIQDATNNLGSAVEIVGTAQANSPIDFKFTSCMFTYGQYHIVIGSYVEGTYITNCHMVAADTSVFAAPTVGESGVHISNTHIDSAKDAIIFNNMFDFTVSGCLIYTTRGAGAYSGIVTDNGGRFNIIGNTFKGSYLPSIDEQAVKVNSSINDEKYGGLITGNAFHDYGKQAIWLTSAANYIHVGDNIYRRCLTSILNQGTQNSRSYKSIAKSDVFTLTGGAPSENITITIPTNVFFGTPESVIVQAAEGQTIIGSYRLSSSTNTSVVVKVYTVDGTNLPSGSVRFSYTIAGD